MTYQHAGYSEPPSGVMGTYRATRWSRAPLFFLSFHPCSDSKSSFVVMGTCAVIHGSLVYENLWITGCGRDEPKLSQPQGVRLGTC